MLSIFYLSSIYPLSVSYIRLLSVNYPFAIPSFVYPSSVFCSAVHDQNNKKIVSVQNYDDIYRRMCRTKINKDFLEGLLKRVGIIDQLCNMQDLNDGLYLFPPINDLWLAP